MPSGRRRRFSVKQEICTKLPKDIQSNSDLNKRNSEQKTKTSPQNCKPNKLKNKELASSSKHPSASELSVVIECNSHDSSPYVTPNKIQSVDKDVTATASNIDFYNVLNVTNVLNSETVIPTAERPGVNQTEKTNKKETKNRHRDNHPQHHRVKVRSPKRRNNPSFEEVLSENNKTTKSLGTMDWDREQKETSMAENRLTKAEKPLSDVVPFTKGYQILEQGNTTADPNNKNPQNLGGVNQKIITNQGNNDSLKPKNYLTDPGNITVQSYPVYLYGMSPVNQNYSNPTNQNSLQNAVNQDSQPHSVNHPSNNSLDVMCRICHGGDSLSPESGEMISACGCRGTVGRVHVKCLERWLTESGKSRCELCGTRYSIKRVHKYGFPKGLAIWVLSQNAKQLMVDSLGIMLMSPLAVVAAWLSGRTLAGMMAPESQNTPWPLASTFVLACMTLVCYYCWIVSAVTRHALGWWIWYRSQYEVRLQLQDSDD